MDRFERIKSLLGNDFSKFQNIKVLLLGVGGVGGFCLDCLSRSGVKDITIVDFDSFDITNLNRQLHSQNYINTPKTDAMKQEYPHIKTITQKVTKEWVEEFDFEAFDIVLDAIDDTKAKVALAKKTHKKLISSFGSANRLNPAKIEVADVWKSHGDKLGAKIRYELRKSGFRGKYKVIFSSEEPKGKGSFMGVSATFGLFMCAEALKKAIKNKDKT